MSEVAIRAAGLTKRYGSVRALDGLDLEVGVGEVHAFLGPNARQLSRLAFRRDAAVLPACVFGIAALLAITARDLKVLYPTAASRLAVAAKASANPALRFLLGRLNGTSVGAFLAARWGVWGRLSRCC